METSASLNSAASRWEALPDISDESSSSMPAPPSSSMAAQMEKIKQEVRARPVASALAAPFVVAGTVAGAAVQGVAAVAVATVAVPVAAGAAGGVALKGDARFHSGPCSLQCTKCHKLFTFMDRKTHCRSCNTCVCHKCRQSCCDGFERRPAGRLPDNFC